MEPDETTNSDQEVSPKQSKKELIVRELKEILAVIIYLAVSLSIWSTIRSLVLIQHGINDFLHGLTVSLILSVGLGKVVVLAQKLPLLKACDKRALIYSILYKSTVMTLIVNGALHLETKLFDHHAPEVAVHPILMMLTHQIVLLIIFLVLFAARGIDRAIGHGVLIKLVFSPPKSAALEEK